MFAKYLLLFKIHESEVFEKQEINEIRITNLK